MTTVIDQEKYAKLLTEQLPRVISSDEEHTKLKTAMHDLMLRTNSLSPEERELMRLIIAILQDYENKRFRPGLTEAAPLDILEHLMMAHGHNPKDLWPVIGDKGTVSKMLSGEREISKAQAKKLASLYKVSPGLFI